MKLSRRGVDGLQFRQVFLACAINDRETQEGKLIIYPLGDGKPVQNENTNEMVPEESGLKRGGL